MSSPPPPPPPPSPDYYYYMVVTIAVIIIMLVASNIATFACHRRRPIVNPRIAAPHSRVEDRIPVTKYMIKDCAHDADEQYCSVCLTGFVEGEELRQLPGCTHAFHAPCIDMWLHSHSTCPLCRRTVMALPPPQRCPAVDAAGMQAEAQRAPVFTEASNLGQLAVAIV